MLSLQELRKLIKLCRATGVLEYTSPEVSFKLSLEAPNEVKAERKKVAEIEEAAKEKIATLTEEELLLWSSSSPVPESEV